MSRTVYELVLAFFQAHPGQPYPHGPVVDWVTHEWLQEHDTPPRDPWRAVRLLHQQGKLIKVAKGVYLYDPELVAQRHLEDFTSTQRQAIFERDQYRCVICGLGIADGVEIHADHIQPKDKGGKATIENGQTLCAQHNFQKKHYKQTETGKRLFIRLYHLAKSQDDHHLLAFCTDILNVFEHHNINGHIDWER